MINALLIERQPNRTESSSIDRRVYGTGREVAYFLAFENTPNQIYQERHLGEHQQRTPARAKPLLRQTYDRT